MLFNVFHPSPPTFHLRYTEHKQNSRHDKYMQPCVSHYGVIFLIFFFSLQNEQQHIRHQQDLWLENLHLRVRE